tara:strand:- start:1360 stop:1473 length:114 start_codon:yes stop_codon:yes gene_type:complete
MLPTGNKHKQMSGWRLIITDMHGEYQPRAVELLAEPR